MMKNYDKYQSVWHSNIKQFEEKRATIDNSALNKNYKVNRAVTQKGDITIVDRIE